MLGPRNPMGDVAERTTDPKLITSALLLTDVRKVTAAVVNSWSDEERAEAFEWAMREHLSAADNDWVVRFAKPKHVEALGLFTWEDEQCSN